MPERRVAEIVGVYRADGGVRGELAYVVGRLLGGAHCSLCDITHATVRRKPDWDALVRRLGVPVTLLHLNEMPPEVAALVARTTSPVVLVRDGDRLLEMLLDASGLDALGGSVAGFEAAVRDALARRGWSLP